MSENDFTKLFLKNDQNSKIAYNLKIAFKKHLQFEEFAKNG